MAVGSCTAEPVKSRADNAPTINNYSPQGTDVDVDAQIVIHFSEPMNLSSLAQAFSISPQTIGAFQAGETTLTFIPSHNLDYGTQYTVTISTDAKSSKGVHLEQEFQWSFETEEDTTPEMVETGTFWETWEPIITLAPFAAMGIIVLIVLIFNMRQSKKRRKRMLRYMDDIDGTFKLYKNDPEVCEGKLRIIRRSMENDWAKDKLSTKKYMILSKKIEDYIVELKIEKAGSKD
ncbi:MAG: Ig-like domain-containing protein [Thermoplasmata archaeon]|nr:MAG: Ig-like domain-containing protein [Thermoplasmata archaeon]